MGKKVIHPPEYYTKKAIPVKELVDKQYRKGRFNRMDMVMRLLCLESDKWWKQYRKMQFIRIVKIKNIRPDKFPAGFEKKRVKQFKALIASFKEKGYDWEVKGIRTDSRLALANGSHRLACAIHFDINEVPIKWPADSTTPRREYSLKWFIKHSFSNTTIEALERKRLWMLEKLELPDREKDSYLLKVRPKIYARIHGKNSI